MQTRGVVRKDDMIFSVPRRMALHSDRRFSYKLSTICTAMATVKLNSMLGFVLFMLSYLFFFIQHLYKYFRYEVYVWFDIYLCVTSILFSCFFVAYFRFKVLIEVAFFYCIYRKK